MNSTVPKGCELVTDRELHQLRNRFRNAPVFEQDRVHGTDNRQVQSSGRCVTMHRLCGGYPFGYLCHACKDLIQTLALGQSFPDLVVAAQR